MAEVMAAATLAFGKMMAEWAEMTCIRCCCDDATPVGDLMALGPSRRVYASGYAAGH